VPFVDGIMNSTFLGLDTLLFSEGTLEQMRAGARDALDAVNNARSKLVLCLHGAYDQVPIVGVSAVPGCAGGFSERDWRVVVQRYVRLRDVLLSMGKIAETSITNVQSQSDRKIDQADLAFLLQSTVNIGVSTRAVSRRTNLFLAREFNPVSLGIRDVRVDGSTVEDAAANALTAHNAVQSALLKVQRCVFRRESTR